MINLLTEMELRASRGAYLGNVIRRYLTNITESERELSERNERFWKVLNKYQDTSSMNEVDFQNAAYELDKLRELDLKYHERESFILSPLGVFNKMHYQEGLERSDQAARDKVNEETRS